MDEQTGDMVLDVMLELGRDDGSSLLIVTYSRLAARLDRTIVIRDGKIE